jgi:hypothetical protein
MYQQLWGYKVEEKLYLGVREQKRLNTTDLDSICVVVFLFSLQCRSKQRTFSLAITGHASKTLDNSYAS